MCGGVACRCRRGWRGKPRPGSQGSGSAAPVSPRLFLTSFSEPLEGRGFHTLQNDKTMPARKRERERERGKVRQWEMYSLEPVGQWERK